ncbi:hypothetical protein H257_18887 [Aphanomyces astaci]|uniref:DDE Tnp4 domain-containing protein n=1 Tax=Aphanomyces astaci TaxID=112090 RepID=W4FBV8_APHAT|nr:hypothetical protein H257_18887 [Aphanomyces astaci]ETV64188.1 hypothetical protein H257_18887 [Aphanomyces astaci]|eukprot:XP_009846326.1 hypothetical protein H257_18887 [Aphanomyces astaci]
MPRRYSLQDSQSPSQPTPQPTQQPSHVNTRAFTRGMALLEDLEQQRRDKLARFTTVRQEEPDEDADSNSPIYDAFLSTQGPEGIFSLTNFSPSEFDLLWADLRHFVSKNWNVGSGRKSEVSARDLLLMMLASMKHCGNWDVVALVFSQKPPTFEKRVLGYIKAVHPFFMRSYVAQLAEQWSMKNLIASGNQFKNFPFARYATDVTFQQTNTPFGSYAEKKHYYSGKHSLYGHKVEISVVPNGFAIFCTEHYKGSISDKTIFDENVDVHKAGLAKQQDETLLADPNREHTSWAVLADKGYQGIQHEYSTIVQSTNIMSSTNTAAHQAVLALLRRAFDDKDTALLLGGMTPDNQTRLVEGIGSTIDLSVAEATAAQKALEEQVAQMSSHRRNLEDSLRIAREKIATLEDQASTMSPMVAPSKILSESLTMRSRASRALRSWKHHRLLA